VLVLVQGPSLNVHTALDGLGIEVRSSFVAISEDRVAAAEMIALPGEVVPTHREIQADVTQAGTRERLVLEHLALLREVVQRRTPDTVRIELLDA
jgi:hypothetical protein